MKRFLCFCLLAALAGAAGCTKDRKTEPEPPAPPTPPTVQGTDLSSESTANCYMVHAAGEYSFDATARGNGVPTSGAPAGKLSPVSAGLVWQDTPELLSDVRLEEGRVRFTAGEKHGNALLAVYGPSGEILWSWHIWATDYDPARNAPGLNGMKWMTRNLGAMSGDYDPEGTAKGMVYQWGRKDPFPSIRGWADAGESTVYDADGNPADGMFPTEQVPSASNMENAVTHPTTFFYGTRGPNDFGPYDWLTTDAASMNNRLWETAENTGKTLFDPCPPGWRVPRSNSWKGLGESTFIWDDAAFGRRHALLGYYPAVGDRGAATGEWSFVGGSGTYWSSSPAEGYYVSILYFLPSYLETTGNDNRSGGKPVRCVSETEGEPDIPAQVDTTVLDRATEASYIGFAGQDGSANYYIGLADVPFEMSDDGEQIPLEPGMIMYIDLYGEASPEPEDAVLPEGAYNVGGSMLSGTANPAYTWARVMTPEGRIVYRKTVSGKVSVKHTADGYSITALFTDTEGKDFAVAYSGPLSFTDRTPAPTVPVVENPVNATFTAASATWEYTSDRSDRYTVRLLDGRTENGELAEGCQMVVDLLSEPLSEKGNMEIKPGIYRVGNDYVSPMTFTAGALYNFLGVPFIYGSYYAEAQPDDGKLLYGFAVAGTIEVERSGSRYGFKIDVTTPEGVAVKGAYATGEVEFIDNAPWEPAGDWLSILREDKTVIFSEDDASECRVWQYDTETDGQTEYEILVDNNTTDEAFQLNIIAPADAASFAGTYVAPADPDRPKAGEFIPGWKQYAVIKGTWGYLFYDFRISNYIGAPATEGTIRITDLEDGRIEIQYELKDDAQPKNTVRSIWSGSVRKINY